MKRLSVTLLVAIASASLLAFDVEARRLGGGKSAGAKRDTVTQRQAPPQTPQQQATPAQPAQANAAAPAKAASPAAPAATPPRSGMSRWLGPLAGLAAGLGLATLMSSLGFNPDLGGLLLVILLAVGAFLLFRMFRRMRASQQPLQYAGAGVNAAIPAGYETQPTSRFDSGFGGAAANPAIPAEIPAYPPGFDAATFLRHAKINFTELQAAYDKGDLQELRDVMTPEMFAEISKEIAERGAHYPSEIMKLDAEIIEVTTEDKLAWASVRFYGLIREKADGMAESFNEVWNLQKPISGETGWLLAGIQQLN